MTAQKIIEKALLLLGLGDMQGNTADPRFQSSALSAVNAVYADLFFVKGGKGFTEISDTSQSIEFDEKILYDVMPYGVAAFIAQSLGDMDNQQYFSMIYNTKRKTVVNTDSIQDTLPSVEG